MYGLLHHPRRLLQETALIMASSPASNSSNADNSNQNSSVFDTSANFSPSMAIILVILLSAFFFMAFFSIYIKRCSASADAPGSRTTPAAGLPRPVDAPPQGIDPAILESFPLVAYSSAKKKGSNIECVVCLTDFEEAEPLCRLPRCKHVFHKDCIDMWLFSHTTCPLCRRSVISEGSRSFRWGGGTGSLRLTIAWRGSGRGSATGTGPSTPTEGQPRLLDAAVQADFDSIERHRLSRSHSTGHSLLKEGQSSVGRGGLAELLGSDSSQQLQQLNAGCVGSSMEPAASFQRSRSYAAFGPDIAAVQNGISGWMREAGASVKRVLSMKRVSPGPVHALGASSSAAAFDRFSHV